MANIKKKTTKNNNSFKIVGDTHAVLVGVQSGTVTMQTSVRFPRKPGINLYYNPDLPTYSQRALYLTTDICSSMFIASLFKRARTWKQPRWPLAEKRIIKTCFVYTMQCYLAVKKSVTMKSLCKWVELENITQSELTQTQKSKCHIYSFIC